MDGAEWQYSHRMVLLTCARSWGHPPLQSGCGYCCTLTLVPFCCAAGIGCQIPMSRHRSSHSTLSGESTVTTQLER
eukprot:7132167-Alexandrium_andersonii.AAC.1